ncbi:MAG: hypothetical protein UU40_C0008G0023 [Candidatus Uhrbacteria bacterium GW2011_GWD2_41_121]|uniref:Uncharacterized protein n=1 Tax=Candidatus Uhrbacteria bacterium GW2011_GWC1_41_20 TaxID=1618983 RepID=A0A0G0YFM3_9BACT|nr:MAG: hypothetical protein UU04_C0007G0002 [Candidatus Uhrbacteria bacterium GW2011_GWC2_40_450]KKR90126.1 MAG: hypothetical protein UU40_C0008G0023 [Candidatus Uhrbacteria bacterium GW2011_GWD2_41_121]KKR99107.1 MAG: hypothetical protein UU50_C0010G0002 [Candidatus Uhrbacteria bacterium GW2011_GWC1_41_20]KKS17515.1 MAG: hypothetical protein UU75_C0018G0025 [Candidatus Uhrbacteria bacterium GW2011_GWB1_41_7]KKS51495.1 MAG: hypothetical protein UV15_C0008G0023 [Candidatus Uhrbacteria bacterium
MVNGETTTDEIMEFMRDHMATKEDLKDFVRKSDLEVLATKQDLGALEHRLRDAFDDKLADFKGDLVVLMRKEDTKLCELVEILQNKDVITKEEAGKILGMQPFPQIS